MKKSRGTRDLSEAPHVAKQVLRRKDWLLFELFSALIIHFEISAGEGDSNNRYMQMRNNIDIDIGGKIILKGFLG